MKWLILGFGALLFATATAMLMLWGMRKAYFQRETLARRLLSKCAAKVMRYLKTHETITRAEMLSLCEGTSTREFMSSQGAIVQHDDAFAGKLAEAMLADGLIEEAGKGRYRKKMNKE